MKFEHAARVAAAPDVVFALTQDYARRLTWDPFLSRAELRRRRGRRPAVGVRAWCVAKDGIGMETEYVTFAPPRLAAVKMTRGPWLLESFGGAWEFAPDGAGTLVLFRYQFRMRPRWLAWAVEPMARAWFSRETPLCVSRRWSGPSWRDVMRRSCRRFTCRRGAAIPATPCACRTIRCARACWRHRTWLSQLVSFVPTATSRLGVLGAAVVVGLGVAAVTYARERSAHRDRDAMGAKARRPGCLPARAPDRLGRRDRRRRTAAPDARRQPGRPPVRLAVRRVPRGARCRPAPARGRSAPRRCPSSGSRGRRTARR